MQIIASHLRIFLIGHKFIRAGVHIIIYIFMQAEEFKIQNFRA